MKNSFYFGKTQLALWGAGRFLNDNIGWLRKIYDILYVVDCDKSKWGQDIGGIFVMPPEILRGKNIDVLITVENQLIKKEIQELINERGLKEHKLSNNDAQKKLYVWGTLDECRKMFFLLGESQEDYFVEGFITLWPEQVGCDSWLNTPIVSLFRAEDKLRNNDIDGILAVADTYHIDFVTRENVEDDILEDDRFFISKKNYLREMSDPGTEVKIEMLMMRYKNYCRFRSLQFTVTAKCNLNCRLCTHFAALVPKDESYTYDEFERDIERASEVIEDVDNLDIWGGEALLCEYLPRAIIKAHEIFPRADVYIGTNGLLIMQMKDELIKAIRETNATLVISMYPPTLKKIDEISKFLRHNNMRFIYGKERVRSNTFRRMFDIGGQHNPKEAWSNCVCGKNMSCHVVYKGRWSQCYLPIFSTFFNDSFNEKFDVENDSIDMYSEDFNSKNIISKSRNYMNSCRYCAPYTYEKWRCASPSKTLDDWVYH